MNILIFGSKGYFGSAFRQMYPDAACPETDIADPDQIAEALRAHRPDVVLNCAGKTGKPNVEWCEYHKEETVRSNVTGPLILLDECRARGIYLVHLSSGCIYDGDNGGKGFTETDPPNFTGSYYSRTKPWADAMLRDYALVLRLRLPFDGTGNPRNLIQKLIRYARVQDEPNSITCLSDFCKVAASLILRRATGIYNVVNEGPISPYEIVCLYRDIVDPSHAFARATLAEMGGLVKVKRSNCVLSGDKLRRAGIVMRPTAEAVREALLQIKAARRGVGAVSLS